MKVVKHNDEMLLVGQIDSNNVLNGIGKKITPFYVMEGQFINNKLCGFGRQIRHQISAIGYWESDNKINGYCQRVKDGKVEEGHFESSDFHFGFSIEKSKIHLYNPNVDIISMKIDYEKYQIKPYQQFKIVKK